MQSGLNFGIFTLVGVIMLVLASASFTYLLQIKHKSRSSWMLLWFFLCVLLSAIATILTNTGLPWEWAFAPSQDALLLLGGVFLVRFAYEYPANDQPGEARLATWLFALVGLGALCYAIFFCLMFLSHLPAQIDEIQAFYVITPLVMIMAVFTFFRRCVHMSRLPTYSLGKDEHPGGSVISHLLHPNNQPAVALRSFGLALTIALVPVIATVSRFAIPELITNYLFNFGVVVAIAAIMLVYLNHAPEPTTITAKLIGIPLVIVLLILGLASVWLVMNTPATQKHSTISMFIYLVLLSTLLIVLIYPRFFRSTLLNPLDRLLDGFRRVNTGDLDIQVEVQYDDEIGFLTTSFNRMVSSLNEATELLKDESSILERQVVERTTELRYTNEQLINENLERKEAQARLDRQLRYEQALAGCSRALLLVAEDEKQQQQVLDQALEHLRVGAQASRAYVFCNLEDPDLGLCMRILAEACASDIQPQIHNPANQKFPWSRLPVELLASLRGGSPHGGPVERVFLSTPDLLDAFLRQSKPLLSIQIFPITINEQWWGFVGFDDCETSREWDEGEILMLRTASEMIGNTIQRWQAEKHLRETLENLEQRVHTRTIELSQANAELRYEIHERQRFQAELEERLGIESTLAKISARLLSPLEIKPVIEETLADLGQVVQASQAVFVEIQEGSGEISSIVEWHAPGDAPVFTRPAMLLDAAYSWFTEQLASRQSVYIKDVGEIPDTAQAEKELLISKQIHSLLLSPVMRDQALAGLIACGNPNLPAVKISENLKAVEVIASMLGSMLHRASLLNLLEERIAERTRELSAFFDLTMLVGDAEEISDLMQPALAKLIEISSSSAGLILLYDSQQEALRPVALRGLPGEVLSGVLKSSSDRSMIEWMERIGEKDAFGMAVDLPAPESFRLLGYPIALHIPLRARGKNQGVLSCYRQDDIAYNPYQISFLNAVGEQLGMAAESFRLRLQAEEAATLQERQRLARELHDAVSQSIYSLTLFARSGRDAVESGDQAKLMENLVQLETNSLAALKEMRLLLYQLRTLALEKGGLVQAIESRFNMVERRSGTQASVAMDESIQLSDPVEQELFLLVTEALNNALKHASASQVSVSIQPENGRMVVLVWNNGASFEPAEATGGMGLENMRQRAEALGGQLTISSQAGSGTWIRMEMPRP